MHSAQVFSSEKLRFFKSRCLETFLGASFSLYSSKILSLLLYISPSAIIGFPMFLYNSYYLAINISGLIGLLLLLLVLKLNDPNNNKTIPINSSEQRLFIELKTTKPRKVLILLFLLISTYFYYFLTMSFILETYETNDISYGIRVLELILIHLVTLTSSGSIFFKSPKEFASILPDDRVFNLFSAIFMRPCYVIMILIMKIVYSGYWYNVIISIIYFSLLPLWTFGILGGLMNTGLWGIETLNSILFGDSFKIKHENLIMTFLFNCGISVILTIVLYFNADSICLIFYLILTLASLIKNFDFIKFKRNLKLKRIEMEYLFMPGIILVQVFSVCLGLFNGFTSDNMYFDKKYQIILIVLGAIAGFFCVFNWLEAVFMNRLIALKFWRNCFKKRENCHFLRKTVFRASLIQLSLFFIAMTFARSVALKTMNDKSLLGIWLWSALLLRVFNLCWFFHLKLFLLLVEGIIIVIICQLEPYWVIYFAPLLDIGNGFLFRIVSRTISFFYSLYKMKTTKSLRLENPNKFIILSITLLFPLNFLNILITSLFNIPIIGLFGMPLLFSGSLRPHRLWATLNSSLKPDFEAYIYKAIIEQFKISIPELIYEHPDEFQPEDYYLLRMGKIIGIFNVIERGFNYIGLNFRGLEMQEPTSCHNLESNSIDDIIKSVSNGNRRVFTSLFTIMFKFYSIFLNNLSFYKFYKGNH